MILYRIIQIRVFDSPDILAVMFSSVGETGSEKGLYDLVLSTRVL